jgi:hypothetical protein
VRIILSNTGQDDAGTDPKVWDTENDPERAMLHAAAGADQDRAIDRMSCTQARIGHKKFAVYVRDDRAVAVLTGSTNWTNTGLCAQSNNCIIVDDPNVADAYWDFGKGCVTTRTRPASR